MGATVALGVSFAAGYQIANKIIRDDWAAYLNVDSSTPGAPTRKEARAYGLPLNNPDMVPAAEATHMRPDDPVYGVFYNGQTRAYPRWLLIAFHVVNDTVNGEPLLVTQCEVCSSATAFVPISQWPPNEAMTFSACGFHGGTFYMCDGFTNSRWHPFSGVAFDGFLKGSRLTARVPVTIRRWKEWKTDHPETVVAFGTKHLRGREHSHGPEFDIGKPLIPDYMAKTANLNDRRLPLNELVYGISDASSGKAFAIRLGPTPGPIEGHTIRFAHHAFFVVRYDEFAVTAFSVSPGQGPLSVERERPLVLRGAGGGKWNAFGHPVEGDQAHQSLTAADGYFAEWYEWVNEHPGTPIFDLQAKRWIP